MYFKLNLPACLHCLTVSLRSRSFLGPLKGTYASLFLTHHYSMATVCRLQVSNADIVTEPESKPAHSTIGVFPIHPDIMYVFRSST